MAASAATVPASLKSKVASDDQLASVRGSAGITLGGGTWHITLPSLTYTPPLTPIIQPNPPAFPTVVITPIVVNNSGTITITLPTVTITTTPPTITPPAGPLFTFTPPAIWHTP